MNPARPFCVFCLAAFAALAVHAQSARGPQSRGGRGNDADLVSPNAPVPGRYSREAYAPARERPAGNEPAFGQGQNDRPMRIESVRGRYTMQREVSQELHLAIEQAQRTHGGKVLSADRMRHDGREVYRVKLLTPGGRVRVVQLQETQAMPAPKAREQQGEG